MDNARVILLFGGSFNPPHLAHFKLVHAALSALQLHHCDIIPSGAPWQKPHVAPVQHRLAMLEWAVHDDAQRWLQLNPTTPYPIDINPIETLTNQASYTIDTLTALRRKQPQDRFIWLIGSDQLANFHTWRDWQEILKHTHIAVAQRAGHEISAAQLSDAALRDYYQQHHCSASSEQWHAQAHGLFIEFTAPAMAISSSQIRALIQQQHNPCTPELDKMLTKSVQNYISEQNLYQ